MRRNLALSLSMSAAGVALIAFAVFAAPAASKTRSPAAKGGTIPIAHSVGDFDNLDPAIAYVQDDWIVLYSTSLKLLNTPDKPPPAGNNLVPDAATSMPVVSKDGKTYTFTIKKGLKFNNGAPVTAANFKAAFDRDSDPAMNSPFVAFIGDIVGVKAVLDKKAKSVSGVVANGMKLTIHLTQPDGGLLNKVALPFASAIPTNMAHDPNGIQAYPSAGPYYIASRTINRQVVLKKNTKYGGSRPQNSDTIIITTNLDQQQTYLQVRNGTYATDIGAGNPPAENSTLAKQFGVNKGRFLVNKALETWYLSMNVTRGFNNLKLRKAVNYAIDRPALTRLLGFLGGSRTTQLLPPALAGKYYKNVYPIRGSAYGVAKKWAGSLCNGKSLDYWTTTSAYRTAVAQVVKYNMSQVGCNVNVKQFSAAGALYNALGTKGAAFDFAQTGWIADYPDPYDFMHLLLDGTTIVETNNTDFPYFNNGSVNTAIAKANELGGAARNNAYGKLDLQVMQKYAPIAPFSLQNQYNFISGKVAGTVYVPFVGGMDLATFYNK